jgi:hypothetical protein
MSKKSSGLSLAPKKGNNQHLFLKMMPRDGLTKIQLLMAIKIVLLLSQTLLQLVNILERSSALLLGSQAHLKISTKKKTSSSYKM